MSEDRGSRNSACKILFWHGGRNEGEVREKAIRARATTHQQHLQASLSFIFFWQFNEVAVVAALFQLHHNVKEARCASSCPLRKSLVVSCQNPPAGSSQRNTILRSGPVISLGDSADWILQRNF